MKVIRLATLAILFDLSITQAEHSILEKLKSNLQEVQARGGKLIVFAGASAGIKDDNGDNIAIPASVNEDAVGGVFKITLDIYTGIFDLTYYD